MPSQRSASTAPEAGGSRPSWWLPAGTFLAGCALGAVVMGVGDVGEDPAPPSSAVTDDAGSDAGTDAGADAEDGATAAGDDSGLYVRVPDSCVRTADDATALVEQVDEVVAAVAELEPERLRQAVDDVQQVRDGVQDVAEQCRAAAAERLADVDEAEADDAAPETPSS